MLRTIVTLIFLTLVLLVKGQDKSNRGKEFWLAYGFDYSFFHESPVNFQELALYISTEQAATVTVTITNTSYTQTLNIPANTVDATILIPKSGANDARTLTDGLQNRNIHIVSNVNVAVYAHVYSTMVSGATMLMPVETYGYLYHSINYSQATSNSSLPAISSTTANGDDWYSWFYVVASENNTRVEITPSDTTKNGWLPGQTYTVNMNQGESYHVFGKLIAGNTQAYAASKDMTGSKVVSVVGGDGSCHPVALFSGSGGIRICRGDGGEFVHQQVFPAQAWGTRYLTYHTINNPNTNILETNRNYYRVCVADPATVVKKNGIVMTGLQRNFFYEYMDSTGGDYIEANNPVLVAQYTPNKNQCWNFPVSSPSPPSYGDPEMFYLSPIEQGQKAVLFYTSRKSSVDYVYTNILLPTAGVSSLKVDGVSIPAAQIIPHPNLSSFSVALARLIGPAAQHTITSDSSFTATVYGLGNYESYGYNVGTLVNNLNHYSEISNTNNSNGITDTFTCRNTPLRMYVKVAYPALTMHWKLSQVAGIFPNTDSIISNPIPVSTEIINGRTYYVYSLQQDFTFANTGVFFLPVSYTAAVIQNCNQTETASVKIDVKQGPQSNFTWGTSLCLQDTVQFTGTSVPGIFNLTAYEWLFDDATTASTMNTTKRFLTDGPHPVRYRIIADNGCFADTIKTVTILPNPIASFGVVTSICQGDSVYITDTSSVSSGTIASWQWNYGDGNSDVKTNGNPFYHHYNTAGAYLVSLVVTSSNGCKSDTLKRTVTVLTRPTAKFGFDRNVCLGQAIAFSDSSTAGTGVISQWKWNFGDGVIQIKTNNSPFSYSYAAIGNYVVSLFAYGSNGCISDSFKLTVNVTSKPSSEFTLAGKACIDSIYTFISSTSASAVPTNWYWSYGDGLTANINTANTASHAYLLQGTNLRVRHAVTYGGCPSDTTDHLIANIYGNPSASFSIMNGARCEDLPISFSGTGSSDITIWNWDFGNGTGANAPPFTRVYNSAGSFIVKLRVQNAGGCISSLQSTLLNIAVAPVVDAGPDIYLKPGDTKIIDATIANAAAYNYVWTPTIYLNNSSILTPLTSAVNSLQYKVKVTDKINGCVGYDSMQVKIVTKIYIPNIFTPNGDMTNDTWIIPALQGYPEAMVTIFNRYGQKIFESKGYNRPWDGTYKGAAQPSGSYVYIINPSPGGGEYMKGTVTIMR